MSNSIIKLFQIDAFTSEIFKGNPACVMPLENWLSDLLLKIAKTMFLKQLYKKR